MDPQFQKKLSDFIAANKLGDEQATALRQLFEEACRDAESQGYDNGRSDGYDEGQEQ